MQQNVTYHAQIIDRHKINRLVLGIKTTLLELGIREKILVWKYIPLFLILGHFITRWKRQHTMVIFQCLQRWKSPHQEAEVHLPSWDHLCWHIYVFHFLISSSQGWLLIFMCLLRHQNYRGRFNQCNLFVYFSSQNYLVRFRNRLGIVLKCTSLQPCSVCNNTTQKNTQWVYMMRSIWL